jgi:hypothetical protein
MVPEIMIMVPEIMIIRPHMAKVHSKNTSIEMKLRKLIYIIIRISRFPA